MNAYRLRVNLMMSVAVASTTASFSSHQTIVDGEVSMQQHRDNEPDPFSDRASYDGNDETDGDLWLQSVTSWRHRIVRCHGHVYDRRNDNRVDSPMFWIILFLLHFR